MRIKKILFLLFWVLILAGVIVMVVYSGKIYDNIECKKYNINVIVSENSDTLLFASDVEDVFLKNDSLIGKKYALIDINGLEKLIAQYPFVKTVEIYGDLLGNINMTVVQRKPVVRISNKQNEDFYLDETAHVIPLKPGFPAYVKVANGNILTTMATAASDSIVKELNDLLYCVNEINKDDFLKAQIAQIYVQENGMYIFNPLVGNYKIMFGYPENPEKRLKTLKIFYQKSAGEVGWKTYRKIDISFDDMIVCSKNKET